MNIRILTATTLLAIVSLLPWMGCGSDDTSQTGQNTGSVVGTVVLEGADDYSGTDVTTGDESRTTDEEGFYEFERLSPGEVELKAAHEGYVSQTKTVDVVAGEEAVLDFELGFENQPPVIDGVTVEPDVLVPEGEALITVDAFDPDGSELEFDYSATEGFDVEPDEDDPSQATLIAPDAFDVEATLEVTVTDSAGEQATETAPISTRGHDDPVIESVSAVPDVLEPNATATLEVVATSPNDDELSFEWDAPEGWDVEPTDEAIAELTAPDAVDAEATISIVVEDEFGGQATDSVDVRTSEGNAPEITELTVDPPQTEPTGEMALSVEAHDPDGTELSYQWSVSSEWTIIDGQSPQTTIVAPDEYGALAYVQIEVTDEYGLSTTSEIIVSTIKNQGPQIQSLIAVPVEVARGGLIDLEAVATHPQDAELTYDWTVSSDWTLIEDPASPATPQLEAPEEPGIQDTVEVVVTDPDGLEAVASVMVRTLENQAPVIESLDASPAAAVPGESQTIQATAYDPDGEDLSFEWDVPSAWDGDSDTDELVLTAPDEYGATGTVTLTVDDGFDTTTATVTVSTVQNVDPTISSFSADPAVVDRGATSELEIDANHPYGEELSFEWDVDNADWTFTSGAESDDTTATIEAPDVSGDQATITVTVTDDHGGETTSSVTVETASNNPPVISGFTADPQIVDRQGTAQLEVDAYDPDGEPLEYTWSKDNSDWDFIDGASTGDDTATLEAPDIPNSSITVTVTVDDGHGGTASSSVALTTVPSASPVIISVDNDADEWVEREGTAYITVDATHPDGDPIDYDWDVTGDWDIDGSVGAEYEAELTAPDISYDYATVEVTVSDDWGGSDTYTFDIRTQDTEPASFEFEDQDEVGPFDMIVSDAVEVTGFEGPVDAVCSDCEVSVNGGNFDTSVSGIYPGDTVELRRESGDLEETVTASVSVGDTESAQWSITTTDWTGPRVFNPCGQTGRFGPDQSQCDSAYSGTTLDGEITVLDGIQSWTVPTTGTYEISTHGARGGDNSSSPGGHGAIIEGEFDLEAGQELRILVGQVGGERSNDGDDGGGGTFVAVEVDSSDYEMFDGQYVEPVVVAGGGAGGRDNAGHDAGHARTWSANDEGGDDSASDRGGPGGGFRTDGDADYPDAEGRAFINGGVGGDPRCDDEGGGFGGGGGNHYWTGSMCSNTASGGGGFEGGDAGFIDDYPQLGGGSYVSLDYFSGDLATSDGEYDQSSTISGQSIVDLDARNDGPGEVTIDLVTN